ncbi:M14 family metallopeptidase [Aureibacter tunicatorum]|uniref:Peptidase M14 domain-containing protein n=1 Tax=Aureibacter tunicatorum TaxID=866807 RepID=A0AAE4BQK1_9BACT|nr:M14 family metallopeptidase [Aureibacter tunicatorum]MDR6237656.1 hypothetical protein [Aureibacter tunicatorum]BDD02691.1 peptidase M14 [Aureibacter tunicatorum]
MRKIKLLWLLIFAVWAQTSLAQQKLKSPSEFLGYELGDQYTPHHKIVQYFEYVAGHSGQYVKLKEYGKTYEKRPLLLTFIGASDNINRLETIREDNLKKAGVLNGSPENPSDSTIIVWLSYNVHGNEASSSETSMQTLYELVNLFYKARTDENPRWYDNALVIMDPCLNPDGRERYVSWFSQNMNFPANPNVDAAEHHEPWPAGRTNHYLFDLNRDWLWQTQIESASRMKAYNQWLPQVHVDFHEQFIDDHYYFAPGAKPFHENITNWQSDFQYVVGQNNAKYFDQNGWLYFTKESFDLFYPSYGDTYPIFNGAIGMTYEQAGHTQSGVKVETSDGDTLTLKQRIDHHLTTGLATVEISSLHASQLASEFKKYYQQSKSNSKAQYKTYIIKETNDVDRMNTLKRFLANQGIVYGKPLVKRGVRGYSFSEQKDVTYNLQAHDIIINANQAKGSLIDVIFEPSSKLEDSLTYDVTAWSVPYMFDLDVVATSVDVYGSSVIHTETFRKNPVPDSTPYAFVSKWKDVKDVRFLAALLKEDVHVRFATEKFTTGGATYDAGSLIITRESNRNLGSFKEKIIEIANSTQRYIHPVYSGMVLSGKDFGSESVKIIDKPQIALLGGENVVPYRFGEVWYYFEREIEYPINIIRKNYFSSINLDAYDVLILPNGSYSDLLGEKELAKLRAWISKGGKVIALQNALKAFKNKEGFGLQAYRNESEKDKFEKIDEAYHESNLLTDYHSRNRRAISQDISGAIFNARLDNTHPLGFGYDKHYYTMKTSSSRYAYLNNGWNVATIKGLDSRLAGFVGYEAAKQIEESLIFGVENIGKGQIIYMVDDPLFRASWHSGNLIFGNALFLTGQ